MGDGVRVIDTDPELLRRSTEAAMHATEETWIHIRAEVTAADGDYDALMSTLRDEEPYGYTIVPEINGDGTVRAPIIGTRAEVRAAYEIVRGRSDLLSSESLVEARGLWYVFQESYSVGRLRSNGEVQPGSHILGLFPVGTEKGITGELVWPRLPDEFLGRGEVPADWPPASEPLQRRRAILKRHDDYLDAYRAGDVERLVATINSDVQGGVRDYVADHGGLIELRSREETRDHYTALFEKFEILSVDLLDRVIQDWYVFAETRVTARPRAGGDDVAFHLAEFYVTAKDGLFFVRIGHGTDIAPAA
jgi:hypothetical protein